MNELRLTLNIVIEPLGEEEFPGHRDECRRIKTIESVKDAVIHIISEFSDGSVEERDFLISGVIKSLVELHHSDVSAALLGKDIQSRRSPVLTGPSSSYRGRCEMGHEKGQRGCALCEDF